MAKKKKATEGTRKDIGALTGIHAAPEDVEKLSNLQPHELPSNLAPHVKDAVLKRMMEKRGSTPKAPKPSVIRDKKTGKATPKIPATPVVERTADPVVKKFKKGELVTVKPRKQKPQKPIVTKPGQVGKLDGKVVRVTPENLTQVHNERIHTDLPTAGRDVMTPQGRPEVDGAILPRTLRSSQNKKNLGGFARSHKEVSKVTHEALGHLQTMANSAKNSPEFHSSHEAFNTLHGQVGQIGNKVLHRDLGLGKTVISQLHGTPKLANALKIHRGIVLGRLEEGRIAEQSRGDRSGKGGR